MMSDWQLTPLDVTLETLREAVSWNPLGGEQVPLDQALGRVTAEPVVAPSDLPAFTRSTMDGYAVRAADLAEATAGRPVDLRLVEEIGMREAADRVLHTGQCIGLPTGAMLPEGADAVVKLEDAEPWSDDLVRFQLAIQAGDNVLACGSEFVTGEPVLSRGRLIRAPEIAMLASLGVVEVPVCRRPRVAIISTGDELVPPEAEPEPGQVREMNGYFLAALCTAAHAEPRMIGIAPDDLHTIHMVLSQSLSEADLVVISGGASVGEADLVAEAINTLGKPGILIHGVAMKPGKPTIIAAVGSKPVFGLPGHPVSVFISFRVFIAPLLRALGGLPHLEPSHQLITLGADLPSEVGRDDFVPVMIHHTGAPPEPSAVPILGQSAQLSRLLHAEGLIHIPASSAGLSQGEQVAIEFI